MIEQEKWELLYKAKDIERFIYERDNRNELVDKYVSKYGDKFVSNRISSRVNIKNSIKNALTIVVSELIKECPMDTGNAKLNGIRYKMTGDNNSAKVTIGKPSADYVVHLSYGRPNIANNWIGKAIRNAYPRVLNLNKLIGQIRVNLDTSPYIEYGYVEISIKLQEGVK